MRSVPDPLGPTPEEAFAEAMDLYDLAEMFACRDMKRRQLRGRMAELVAAGHLVRDRIGLKRARRRLAIRRMYHAGTKATGFYVVLRRGDEIVRLPFG